MLEVPFWRSPSRISIRVSVSLSVSALVGSSSTRMRGFLT